MALWLIYSLTALFGFTGIYFFIKLLTTYNIGSSVLNFWMFALASIGFLLLSIFQKEPLSVPKSSIYIFIILTFFVIFGNYFSVKAVSIAPNAGYPAAIVGCAAAIMTILSIFFFGADLSWLKMLGVALATIGIILIAI